MGKLQPCPSATWYRHSTALGALSWAPGGGQELLEETAAPNIYVREDVLVKSMG